MSYEIAFSITAVCPCCGKDLPSNSYLTVSKPSDGPFNRDNPYERKDRRVFVTPCPDCYEPKRKTDATGALASEGLHWCHECMLHVKRPCTYKDCPVGVTWEIKVHCSKGERVLRAGMRWRDTLTGSTWEVVEPGGSRIYSPSGLGGTGTFWCRPIGPTPEAAQQWLADAREDGCVSFCGDSIAAVSPTVGVKGTVASRAPDIRGLDEQDVPGLGWKTPELTEEQWREEARIAGVLASGEPGCDFCRHPLFAALKCPNCGRTSGVGVDASARDEHGFYRCNFCGCRTNADIRACCHAGRQTDLRAIGNAGVPPSFNDQQEKPHG